MAKINWTEESQYWLKDIYEYIAQDNPSAARQTVQGIYQKAQKLLIFPEIGYLYEQVAEKEVRILLYGHYRIAYYVSSSGDINILGVFHGALKIEKYLV